MKKLATFIIQSITNSKDFTVEENQEESNVSLRVKANPDITGLIIGKGGKTIKNIRKILSIKATLEGKGVNITVQTD
jgi:predicted RNA-binding protein YlqC (UPF0109 family)